MSDLSKPSLQLLCKLASIVVHLDEYLSEDGHPLDLDAAKSVLADPTVKAWIEEMSAASLAPHKRRQTP